MKIKKTLQIEEFILPNTYNNLAGQKKTLNVQK